MREVGAVEWRLAGCRHPPGILERPGSLKVGRWFGGWTELFTTLLNFDLRNE